jgi:2-oxoglutarate ferredoxin oxidoreductase subunit beta
LLSTLEGVAYAARGSVSSPATFQRTKKFIKTALLKQVNDIGFSYVEVLSPCPPDWHLPPEECMNRIEREVIPEFPVGEFKNVSEVG